MKKLIEGIVDFRKSLTPKMRSLFAALALGQKPDALFIGCSDSRVVPNLFVSTNPGDLFVVRNVGNLVPPASKGQKECSVAAALEFSILSLKVSDVIVCGHSECGAMEALLEKEKSHGALSAWLKLSEGEKNKKFHADPKLSKLNLLSQKNVLEQLEHLKTYSFVKEKLRKKELRLHGWWFDLKKADVYCYEKAMKKFVLIDEKEAKRIIHRMD